jgi:hypothetical protein
MYSSDQTLGVNVCWTAIIDHPLVVVVVVVVVAVSHPLPVVYGVCCYVPSRNKQMEGSVSQSVGNT